MPDVEFEYPPVASMMTPEQQAKLNEPKAWENTRRVMGFPLGTNVTQMTGHFHSVMGMPVPAKPILPTVSQRERRGRLILEEFLELLKAMGFMIQLKPGEEANHGEDITEELMLVHIEGSKYDVVETADALGDLNVVVNGSAVEFGIPMHFIDYEVYTSNLSKADAGGNVIVNHCTKCGPNPDNIYMSTCNCDNEDGFIQPGKPLGKILKPEGFVPTNIPAVLKAYEDESI